MAANCFLSGLVTYFWISNLFSSPFLCRFENTALDHDLFLLYVWGIVSLVRTAYGPIKRQKGGSQIIVKIRGSWPESRCESRCSSQLNSYRWCLPGKVSWNWCWPECLLLLLLPSELIMEDASLIPGSMEEKYWLAGAWTGIWIPDWRFELTMDVRSVAQWEMMGFSQ